MRFSSWRAKAPLTESVTPKVLAVVAEALDALGAESDPECWVVWGDDPGIRYLLFVPTVNGLIQVNVRVNVPGDGPRASGKVVRWNRVQFGELAVEIHGGHRLATFQVETQALHGADTAADAISNFAQALYAAVDGRPIPVGSPAKRVRGAAGKPAGRGSATSRAIAKGA